jgi:hypothetical protein
VVITDMSDDLGHTTAERLQKVRNAADTSLHAAGPIVLGVRARQRGSVDRSRVLSKLVQGPELALAGLASIGFAMTFGYNYGVNNQVVYLLPSLKLLHSDLYRNDWFAMHTTHYHPAFKYLGAALIAIDPRRGWGVGIAHSVVIAVGTACLYWLLRQFVTRGVALAAFLLLITLAVLNQTRGPSGSYVFDGILQPSTLGSAAFLASLPAFASARYRTSGVLLAVSGLFHANYLLLFAASFGVAHLLLGRQRLGRRLLEQLGPSALVLLVFLPTILATAGAANAARAQEIYFNVRAPHHFNPSRNEHEFIPLAAWTLIGTGAGLHLLRSVGARGSRLAALMVGLSLVVWGGTVLATAFPIRQAIQLFSWRIAPHAELLWELIACASAVSLLVTPRLGRRLSPAALALLVSGLGLIVMYYGNRHVQDVTVLIASLASMTAAIVLGRQAFELARPRLSEKGRALFVRGSSIWDKALAPLLIGATAILSYTALRQPLSALERRSTILHGLDANELELFSWMRRQTSKDAVFLTPPYIETIRFHGRRAIVIDWKSNPIVPDEVLEWHKRLAEVTGRPAFRGSGDLAGYDQMDLGRLDFLRSRYRIDYAVVRRTRELALPGYPVVFQNRAFSVLDLRHGRA